MLIESKDHGSSSGLQLDDHLQYWGDTDTSGVRDKDYSTTGEVSASQLFATVDGSFGGDLLLAAGSITAPVSDIIEIGSMITADGSANLVTVAGDYTSTGSITATGGTLTGITLATLWTLEGQGKWMGDSSLDARDDIKSVRLKENINNSLRIRVPFSGTDRNWIMMDTRTGSECIDFGNTFANPDYEFLGSGTVKTNGPVTVTGDIDLKDHKIVNVSEIHSEFGIVIDFDLEDEDESSFYLRGGDEKFIIAGMDAGGFNHMLLGATTGDGGVVHAKGKWNFNVDITLPKSKLTTLGGYAIKLTNKTGAGSVQGKPVKADTVNNDAVMLGGALEDEIIGVFLDDGIADGDEAWIVISGIADVRFADNQATTKGYWVSASSEAGYADNVASPNAARHWEEIGHCIESVAAGGAGVYILAKCVLHLN